jgi:hypothetical protein
MNGRKVEVLDGRSRSLPSFGQPAGLGCLFILMHQKSNGSTSRLRWISQILDVVAICDHIGFFSLRELKQKVAGDH